MRLEIKEEGASIESSLICPYTACRIDLASRRIMINLASFSGRDAEDSLWRQRFVQSQALAPPPAMPAEMVPDDHRCA
jgi:hypothetical protein